MKNERMVQIDVDNIMPHPKNPRKDLGDLAELTESIRLHGVMQNLLVIEREEALLGLKEEYEKAQQQVLAETMDKLKESRRDYVVLLGHRRLEAAINAGLETVPCVIEGGLSLNEQISLMLLENMQRNNLTVMEEAESFQMMLDLGDTVQSVSEKSGFSESTVRHRVELTKLDQGHLAKALEKSERHGYQMTLADLARLERVDNVKERNKILQNAESGRDIEQGVTHYLEDAQKKKHAKIIRDAVEEIRGIALEKTPDNYRPWDVRYKTLWEIPVDKNPAKELKKAETAEMIAKLPEDAFLAEKYSYFCIAAKAGKKKEELSKAEKEVKELEKRKRDIKKLTKAMVEEWENYLIGTLDGSPPPDNKHFDLLKAAYNLMEKTEGWMSANHIRFTISDSMGKLDYWTLSDAEKEEVEETRENAPLIARMLLHICKEVKNKELCTYDGKYDEETGAVKNMASLFKMLEAYGYDEFNDDYLDLLSGRHELYMK